MQLLAFSAIICLLSGFLFSKVISNIGFLFAGIYTLIYIKSTRNYWKDLWMLSFLGLAAVVLVSDFYWNGAQFLQGRGLMKMVLILLPMFIFCFSPDKKHISLINNLVIITMAWSTIYSLWFYFSHFDASNEAYKIAKVMKVLAYRDHIRISWITVVSCLLAIIQLKMVNSKSLKYFYISYIVIQVIFLHILASKTGLITLYITGFIFILAELLKFRTFKLIWILPLFVLIPWLAYKVLPSFEQRVNYTIYDFSHYTKGEFKDGLSDAIRFNSIRAGVDIIKENPIKGVGFINLHEKTNQWYDMHIPQLPEKDRFIPISQILVYWAGGGILGLLIICSHMILPLFKRKLRSSVLFLAFYIPLLMSMFYETHLENQLSLSVYAFFTGWFWYVAENNHKEILS